MQTNRTSALTAILVVAVCGAASACGTGDSGGGIDTPSGPLAIQPQPIPDDGFDEYVIPTSLTATATATGLDLNGAIGSQAPAPGVDLSGSLAVIDMTLFAPVVRVTTDAKGAFTFHVPGGAIGDHLFVFFPDVDQLPGVDVVATATSTATAPCLTFAGGTSVRLPAIAEGTTAAVSGLFASTCASSIVVDRIAFVGDDVLTAPAATFTIPAGGNSPTETFGVHPTTATYQTFLIVASGTDRFLISLTGTSH